MLMSILLLVTGLSLSTIATVYAVAGLLAIFPAAPITIMIMGTSLEVTKLVIASWLYRNWKRIPILLKSYFTMAMVVLMFLTSMSIFGYLSKAHLDSGVEMGASTEALQIIDEKIKTQRENMEYAKTALRQMDTQVNEMMGRTTDDKGASKAVTIRKAQRKERDALNRDIAESQKEIAKLQQERIPLAGAVRKVEAEVGPIKYIANLIYGDNVDETLLEKAVRIVILMIVFVFDPLAVLTLIAANWNMINNPRKTESHVEQTEEPVNDEKQFDVEEPEDTLPQERESLDSVGTPNTGVNVSTNNTVNVQDDVAIRIFDHASENS